MQIFPEALTEVYAILPQKWLFYGRKSGTVKLCKIKGAAAEFYILRQLLIVWITDRSSGDQPMVVYMKYL